MLRVCCLKGGKTTVTTRMQKRSLPLQQPVAAGGRLESTDTSLQQHSFSQPKLKSGGSSGKQNNEWGENFIMDRFSSYYVTQDFETDFILLSSKILQVRSTLRTLPQRSRERPVHLAAA